MFSKTFERRVKRNMVLCREIMPSRVLGFLYHQVEEKAKEGFVLKKKQFEDWEKRVWGDKNQTCTVELRGFL